ncbi:unnamed protein product [Phytophthora fragariaefolia]|uniref:Unnamed protein product n=1 Tax=Phytophthora fragariaefolia TaxID=1490495 RepID=A0A9W6UAP3_9STRA|nr:unnamed protein product [Phytophthora fragariaefolia]
MSTDHPQTDGETERVNRVLEDTLRSVCAAEPTKWSTLLPQVAFALNNAVHSSTGFTPFYVNGLRHPPRSGRYSGSSRQIEGKLRSPWAGKHSAVSSGRQGLLNAKNLPIAAVSAVGSTKLRPRFIGPFTVIGVHDHACTLDLTSAMATHPTFYVGQLKPYHPAAAIDPSGSAPSSIGGGHSPSLPAVPPSHEPGLGRIAQQDPLGGSRRGPPRCRPVSRASESNRDARIRSTALPRRSPRIATVSNSLDPVLDQDGPPVQASPAHGAAGDVSPREYRDQPQRVTRRSEDDHVTSPSPPARYPEAVDSFPRPTAVQPDPRNLMQVVRHHAVPASDVERLDRPLHRAPPPLLGTGGVPYFHVEKILRRRGRIGNFQYLVKWRGYPDSDISWEPGRRLEEDCADLVAAFEQAHGGGRG